MPSSASLRHGKTLSFHDHVLKKTKDVSSGLQINPTATTALALSRGDVGIEGALAGGDAPTNSAGVGGDVSMIFV